MTEEEDNGKNIIYEEPLIPRTRIQDRPQDRHPLPLPQMSLPSVPRNDSLIRLRAPAMAEEEDNGENNTYDEPDAQLHSGI